LNVAQSFKIGCAKGLHPNNVATFYNLQQAYDLHNYTTSKIWNCDEFGEDASYNGGLIMFTKVGSKSCIPFFQMNENGC
jgi:hypothetical protein